MQRNKRPAVTYKAKKISQSPKVQKRNKDNDIPNKPSPNKIVTKKGLRINFSGPKELPVIGPLLYIKIVNDEIEGNHITKMTIDSINLKPIISAVVSEAITLISLYGNIYCCKISLSDYFSTQTISDPPETEGIYYYYQPETKKAALWFYTENTRLFKLRPLSSSSYAITICKILSDLAPSVFCTFNYSDIKEWYDTPRRFEGKHVSAIIINKEEEIKNCEIFDKGICDFKSIEKYYFAYDQSKKIYNYKIEEIKYNDSMKKQVNSLCDKSDKRFVHTVKNNFEDIEEDIEWVFDEIRKILEYDNIKTQETKDNLMKYCKKYHKFVSEEVELYLNRISNVSDSILNNQKSSSKYLQHINFDKGKKEFIRIMSGKEKFKFDEAASTASRIFVAEIKEIDVKIKTKINKITKDAKLKRKKKAQKFSFHVLDEIITLIKNTIGVFLILWECGIETNHQENISLSDYKLIKKIPINDTNKELTQIIELYDDVFYILVSCKQSQITYVHAVQKDQDNGYELDELKSIEDNKAFLAWGSNLNRFFLVMNTQKIICFGSAESGVNIHKGNLLYKYSDNIEIINKAFYVHTNRKLLIQCQNNKLHYITTLKTDSKIETIEELTQFNYSIIDFALVSDEKSILIQSEKRFLIFDIDFNLLKIYEHTHQIQAFKAIEINGRVNMFLKHGNHIQTLIITIPQRILSLQKSQDQKNPLGNPIVDLWQMSYMKFGKINQELLGKSDTSIGIFGLDASFRKKIFLYLNSFKCFRDKIYTIDKKENLSGTNFSNTSSSLFKNIASSRVPVHICLLENGNLVPLYNGINDYNEYCDKLPDDKDNLVDYMKHIQFGYLEDLLISLENISVVGIIGKQSSGKSYFLNRVFGTRFDVTAQRCTQGIWASLAFIDDKKFLVLDCEGLFSVQRSKQEEMKMCLFLIAICDTLFLNIGLNADRLLIELFSTFASCVDRLRGSNLFKGSLDVCLKDIGDNEDQGAQEEFEVILDKMVTQSGGAFEKLFPKNGGSTLFHSFEKEVFEEEIDDKRKEILDITPRFTNGKELVDTMKSCLFHIYFDLQMITDETSQKFNISNLYKMLEDILQNSNEKQNDFEKAEFAYKFKIDKQEYNILFDLWDFTENLEYPAKPFIEKIASEISVAKLIGNHNSFAKQLSSFLESLLKARNEAIKQKILTALKTQVKNTNIVDFETSKIQSMLNEKIHQIKLCLRKCSDCSRLCMRAQIHLDNCTCDTDHKCLSSCAYCKGNNIKCILEGGHNGFHICDNKNHLCGKNCTFENCENKCKEKPGHTGQCICAKLIHECGQKCELFDLCRGKCSIDCTIEHSQHKCSMNRCPYQCLICKNFCINPDHLHELIDEEITNPATGRKVKKHLCGSDHFCKFECGIKGICDLELKKVSRVFKNDLNKINYVYIEQIPAKNKCSLIIPAGQLTHNKDHICTAPLNNHKCKEQCPDCMAFCTKLVGHSGLHGSTIHRNKEKCYYISTKNVLNREVEDLNQVLTTGKFKPGDSSCPELCDTECIRNGRGHAHPIKCEGAANCLEVTHKGYARHSKKAISSGGKAQTQQEFDLVECKTFWRISGWEAPVFTKNPEAQKNFSLCNAKCAHKSHTEEIFCTGQVFHTDSLSYANHKFPCVHKDFESHNVIFVIDITGSMDSYIKEVKKTVESLILEWGKYNSKFGIVAFTDHGGAIGNFIKNEPPYLVRPESGKMKDFILQDILNFLETIEVDGGGGNGGEALIDGMHAAIKIEKPLKSKTIYIILTDDAPHGSEFENNSSYPEGCPCNISWRRIVDDMKKENSSIIMVRINDKLDKAYRLFNEQFGGGIILKELINVQDFKLIEQSIATVIQTDLEYSLLYRPD